MSSSSFNIPRHWWGKIIGGVLGLFRGGLTGAVIGALFGHMIDRFIAGFVGVSATRDSFFEALFSVLGHLSKADGRVTEVEIRMVEELMTRMQISGEARQQAIRHFNRGKAPGFVLDEVLNPFAQHSLVRQDLRQMFMEILIEAAFSSGRVTEPEQQILLQVARQLRIPGPILAAMMQARAAARGASWSGGPGASGGAHQRAAPRSGSLEQAFAQLGLTPKASNSEVKRAYRKLVSQYHPDKLVSQGLPEEMMEMAKNRVREINTAYDHIKQERGIK